MSIWRNRLSFWLLSQAPPHPTPLFPRTYWLQYMCGISHEYQSGLLLKVQTGPLGLTLGLRSEDWNCLCIKFFSLSLHFVPFPFPLFRCVLAQVVKSRRGDLALAWVSPHSLCISALLHWLTRKGCNLEMFALLYIIKVNRTEGVDS